MKRNLYQKGNAILNRLEKDLYIVQLVMWDNTEEQAIEKFNEKF